MAILKPKPSSPRRSSSGTSTSSKVTARVSDARWPMLSSFLPTVTPGWSAETMKPVMPLWPASLSVLARTKNHFALARRLLGLPNALGKPVLPGKS